jgi:hypothetical protein
MPKLRSLLPLFAILLFVAAAHTQETPVPAGKGVGSGVGAGSGSGTGSSTASGETKSSGVVGGIITGLVAPNFSGTKGQPFSADVIDETDQFLADGNHIHRENHGKFFRDSEGRMRTETELGIGHTSDGEPFVHITIVDPVQHQTIILEPRQKQAIIVYTIGMIASPSGTVPARPGTPGSSPSNSTTPPLPPAQGTSEPGALVESLRIARQAQTNADAPRGVRPAREDLGTSTMEGFTVTGTRLSHTIPAGQRGNDKPMTTITESWFSPDLGASLLTKSESPETGVHTHKLVNIRSGEPDPLLFQVPADYTIREQK